MMKNSPFDSISYISRGSNDSKSNLKMRAGANVLFCAHMDDFEKYFNEITNDILKVQNCVIWFNKEKDFRWSRSDLETILFNIQLIVVPVTKRLLTEPSDAMDVIMPCVVEKHIPILPLMQETGLDMLFQKKFGDIHYLFKNGSKKSDFEDKLGIFLNGVFVSDKTIAKIRKEFAAYIFLSYRKKDRKYAQDLMKLIHSNGMCQDIAIWYDEFLVPGENFNEAINLAMNRSRIFALVVTPSLLEDDNYVMKIEYPYAKNQSNMVIFPVEMATTDHVVLAKKYIGIPNCIQGNNKQSFDTDLSELVDGLNIKKRGEDEEHKYLIGLAYLNGIDVEVNADKAVELLFSIADPEDGEPFPEAIHMLATMYHDGKGVGIDILKSIEWRKKYLDYYRLQLGSGKTDAKTFTALLGAYKELAQAFAEINELDNAINTLEENCLLLRDNKAKIVRIVKEKQFNATLLNIYENLCDYSIKLQYMAQGARYYEKIEAILNREGNNYQEYVRDNIIARQMKRKVEIARQYFNRGSFLFNNMLEKIYVPRNFWIERDSMIELVGDFLKLVNKLYDRSNNAVYLRMLSEGFFMMGDSLGINRALDSEYEIYLYNILGVHNGPESIKKALFYAEEVYGLTGAYDDGVQLAILRLQNGEKQNAKNLLSELLDYKPSIIAERWYAESILELAYDEEAIIDATIWREKYLKGIAILKKIIKDGNIRGLKKNLCEWFCKFAKKENELNNIELSKQHYEDACSLIESIGDDDEPIGNKTQS